jgi:hypothetical protein
VQHNNFTTSVLCPACGQIAEVTFDADIGELRRHDFHVGDVVVPDRPLTKPFGPELATDFSRAFWAIGVGTDYGCGAVLRARVHVRDRRFLGVTVAAPGDGVFSSGYSSSDEERALLAHPFRAVIDDGTF